MTNVAFDRLDDIGILETINEYREAKRGDDLDALLKVVHRVAAIMSVHLKWDDSPNAGFTAASSPGLR